MNIIKFFFPPFVESKNVYLFITHCGISSTIEAIYTATPVIAIPVLLDQFQNGRYLTENGAGKYIDFNKLTKNELLSGINEVINNATLVLYYLIIKWNSNDLDGCIDNYFIILHK